MWLDQHIPFLWEVFLELYIMLQQEERKASHSPFEAYKWMWASYSPQARHDSKNHDLACMFGYEINCRFNYIALDIVYTCKSADQNNVHCKVFFSLKCIEVDECLLEHFQYPGLHALFVKVPLHPLAGLIWSYFERAVTHLAAILYMSCFAPLKFCSWRRWWSPNSACCIPTLPSFLRMLFVMSMFSLIF